MPDKFQRYSNKFSRTLKYDIKTLKGIIFGLRTTLEDKLELIQKLVRLRKSVHDFEFYQAEFDDDTQKIYVREKFLLIKMTVLAYSLYSLDDFRQALRGGKSSTKFEQ